jgi:hypothetical protein
VAFELETPNSQLETNFGLAVAEGFEPSVTGLTIRRLTNLATPQKIVRGFRGQELLNGSRDNREIQIQRESDGAVGGVAFSSQLFQTLQ